MALSVKPGAIAADVGNKLILVNVSNTSYAITGTINATTAGGATTDCWDLGLLANSSNKQTSTRKTYSSEDGEVQKSSFTYERMTTGMLMQSDKDLINFLADETKGKTYLECHYRGLVNDVEQWIFKIVQITPQYDSVRPDGSAAMPYESTGVKMKSALTFVTTTMASINTAFSGVLTGLSFPTYQITIPVSASFVIEENA